MRLKSSGCSFLEGNRDIYDSILVVYGAVVWYNYGRYLVVIENGGRDIL